MTFLVWKFVFNDNTDGNDPKLVTNGRRHSLNHPQLPLPVLPIIFHCAFEPRVFCLCKRLDSPRHLIQL